MSDKLRYWPLLCALVLSACVGPRSAPSPRYYLLEAPSLNAPLVASSTLNLAVGPVELADYLDQPLLVTHAAGNELQLLESARWATPLVRLIPGAVRDSLERLLPGARTVAYPSALAAAWDYRVALEIQRLDGQPGGGVTLIANWRVFDGDGVALAAAAGEATLTAQSAGNNIDDFVAAQARLVGELAQLIARALPR